MTKTTHESGSSAEPAGPVEHLDKVQVIRLTQAFRSWHDAASSSFLRKVRGRYWLSFLLLRFTGARIGEILRIDDTRDINFQSAEIRIVAPSVPSLEQVLRVIPVPQEAIHELIAYLEEFPGMRGRVFALDQGNFRREFYKRAEEANIPRELSHPHILRHTRAIELLMAGVPLPTVQSILGHAWSSTTAMLYIRRSEISIRIVLEEKGLL